MTRQEAIKRLHDEKSRIVNRLCDARNAGELSRLLDEIARRQRQIRILETMFCDLEGES